MKAGPLDRWFAGFGWKPFAFQRECWQAYRDGESGLLHASTGTGKTYAAFGGPLLEALADKAVSAKSPPPLKVLWLTPLRALSADTAKALESPLGPLGLNWDVGLRTGDTSAGQRAKQRTRLPTVLVTTPESLCLLLTHEDSRAKFAGLRAVIVDEWHELLSSKRGVLVELALARLRTWQPELRTWGLSATLGNTTVAAETLLGMNATPRLIRGEVAKKTIIESLIPDRIERFPWAGHLGLGLVSQVVERIDEGRTALVFTNTRAQAELWYQNILKAKPEWAGLMALHHGSLDRGVRDWVEDQLRIGALRCVVCTSSLDLGVDFSPVDRVVQIGSPKGVARLLQRAGRSGHQPGGVSRILCVPTNAFELVEVAAARTAAEAGKIEGREPYAKPLDVLAQHIVSSALAGGFRAESLYREVTGTRAFHDLTPAEWLWAIDFAVRGGDTLKAYPDFRRIVQDGDLYAVTDRKVAQRHRMTVGTIVSEASMQVRYLSGGKLGHVEESFAAKLKKGDRFSFAGKMLEFVRVHEMTLLVKRSTKKATTVPRWMGSRMPLSTELAAAVREQLELARTGRGTSPELRAVAPVLETQAAWSRIPAPDELLIERLRTREGFHLFLYPFEGRLAHEGLAALLAYRFATPISRTFSLAVNDYGIELLTNDAFDLGEAELRHALRPEELGADILASINAAEVVKRQFREVARVAGLVSQGYPGQPKSSKQLQANSGLFYEVFREYDPGNLLLHQARREVLERQFEQSRLKLALDRLTRCKFVLVDPPKPTPLAFPLLVERLRSQLSTESLAERVQRMTKDLERALDRGRGDPT